MYDRKIIISTAVRVGFQAFNSSNVAKDIARLFASIDSYLSFNLPASVEHLRILLKADGLNSIQLYLNVGQSFLTIRLNFLNTCHDGQIIKTFTQNWTMILCKE